MGEKQSTTHERINAVNFWKNRNNHFNKTAVYVKARRKNSDWTDSYFRFLRFDFHNILGWNSCSLFPSKSILPPIPRQLRWCSGHIACGIPSFAPTISALIATGYFEGKTGSNHFAKSLFKIKVKYYWYVLVFFLPIFVYSLPILFNIAIGNPSKPTTST